MLSLGDQFFRKQDNVVCYIFKQHRLVLEKMNAERHHQSHKICIRKAIGPVTRHAIGRDGHLDQSQGVHKNDVSQVVRLFAYDESGNIETSII